MNWKIAPRGHPLLTIFLQVKLAKFKTANICVKTFSGHPNGDFRTRLLHILSLYYKKQPKLIDLKQTLTQRQLATGSEIAQIEVLQSRHLVWL